MKITGNEPASAAIVRYDSGVIQESYQVGHEAHQMPGLTIRQHFAAMAMQGLLSQSITYQKDSSVADEDHKSEPVYKAGFISKEKSDCHELAKDAVAIADALITELNK